MNRCSLYLLILCCNILIICSCNSANTSQIGVISIPDGIDNIGLINLSEVAKSIKYIPLETKEESLIGEISNILYDKDHIYVVDRSGTIKIFDNEGRYLRSINRLGRGPEEYTNFISASLVDNNIVVTAFNDVVEYDIFGNFIKRVGSPKIDEYNIFFPVSLGKNSYVAPLVKALGASTEDGYCVVAYDSLSNIRKMVANSGPSGAQPLGSSTTNAGEVMVRIMPPTLFRHNDKIRIFCPEALEILSIDKFDVVDTAFVIDYGQYRVPDGIMTNSSAGSKHISPLSFIESNDYIFMNMSTRATINGTFTANFLHDKRKMQTRVLYDNIGQRKGFKNDIDGGTEFWPQSTFGGKTLISSVSAISMMEYQYDDTASAKIKKVASELTENSNPIITIVELK
jgi:hypothetical protein